MGAGHVRQERFTRGQCHMGEGRGRAAVVHISRGMRTAALVALWPPIRPQAQLPLLTTQCGPTTGGRSCRSRQCNAAQPLRTRSLVCLDQPLVHILDGAPRHLRAAVVQGRARSGRRQASQTLCSTSTSGPWDSCWALGLVLGLGTGAVRAHLKDVLRSIFSRQRQQPAALHQPPNQPSFNSRQPPAPAAAAAAPLHSACHCTCTLWLPCPPAAGAGP
mgnify:CR=1 FL=1